MKGEGREGRVWRGEEERERRVVHGEWHMKGEGCAWRVAYEGRGLCIESGI